MFRSFRLGVTLLVTMAASFAHASTPIALPPIVNTRGYVLIDHQTKRVLAELRADERMEPASTTKLMTAYVLFKELRARRLRLTDHVIISGRAASIEGSKTYVQAGTDVPVEALIKGMIVQSGNDATIALAERVGGTESAFVTLMNEQARRLGLGGTHFQNPVGLPDPNHYSTARDLATLASAIISEFPEYYRFYSLREFTWNNITQKNRNGLLGRDPSVDGMKTGHTESAGYCLVASANRDGMRLVSVVLGSPSMKAREDASMALLDYGFVSYETVKIKSRGDIVLQPRVFMASEPSVAVGLLQDIVLTVRRGEAAMLKTRARLTGRLIAPLATDRPVGELTVTGSWGNPIARVPLFPLQPVSEGGLWTRAVDTVMLWLE